MKQQSLPVYCNGTYMAHMEMRRAYELADRGVVRIRQINGETRVVKETQR